MSNLRSNQVAVDCSIKEEHLAAAPDGMDSRRVNSQSLGRPRHPWADTGSVASTNLYSDGREESVGGTASGGCRSRITGKVKDPNFVAVSILGNAKEMVAEANDTCAPDKIWNKQIRKRDLDSALARISARAVKF